MTDLASARGPDAGDGADPLAEFLRRAPKVDVHLHLEGAVGPAALDALARRHGLPWAGCSAEELRARAGFRSPEGFFRAFRWVVEEHLRTPEDYALALDDVAERLAKENVREAELSVSAGALLFFGRPLAEILAALDERTAVLQPHGAPELRYVVDAVRGHGPEPLGRVLESIRGLPRHRWPAIGLAGPEHARPARDFADVFADAHRMGILSDVHAGEGHGAASVWDALEHLRADRLIHAIAAEDDPVLVRHLRDRRVPLALNPTSNVRLGLSPSLAEHPAGRWLRSGLRVSVSTDDPELLATTLVGELDAVARTAALSQAEIEALILGGLCCALLPEPVRARRLAVAGAELERLRAELGLEERMLGEPRVVSPARAD